MSVGLLGATGVLDVDGLTIDLVPVGGAETTNLVVNGDFELGDPDPAGWIVDGGAQRVFPGSEIGRGAGAGPTGARAMTGLAVPVEPFDALEVSVDGQGDRACAVPGGRRRGSSSSTTSARSCPTRAPARTGAPSSAGRARSTGGPSAPCRRPAQARPRRAPVREARRHRLGPDRRRRGHRRARPGRGRLDPLPRRGRHDGLAPGAPSPAIEEESALDVSFLLDAPAGKHGFVTVRDGRLGFAKGGRARFFGVSLLPPTAFLEPKRGRRAGRPPGAVGHQPGPARRPRHAARPRPQPLRRHPRRHQGVRPDRPGQARPPDRRP